jgi:hypothetical protein
VLAVPRQQIVDLVSGGNPNMKCVDSGFLREGATPNQFTGERGGLFGDCEARNPPKRPQSASPRRHIPERGLISNNL